MENIATLFEKENPGAKIDFVTGTPGHLMERIKSESNKPDAFLCIGPAGLESLRKMKFGVPGQAKEILRQGLVLVTSDSCQAKVTSLRDLVNPDVRTVGMGRPGLTSGECERLALKRLNIWEAVEPKVQKSPFKSIRQNKVDVAIAYKACCFEELKFRGKLVTHRGINFVCKVPVELCEPFPCFAVMIQGTSNPELLQRLITFYWKCL